MNIQAAASEHNHSGNATDAEYDSYLLRMQRRYVERTAGGANPVFTTSAGDDDELFATYLEAFPAEQKQFHNCSACRRFVKTYGSLVVIADDGTFQSAVFDAEDAPELYHAPIQAILRRVRRSVVTGVFLCKETVWGQPETGVWRHMAVTPASAFRSALLTPFQAMAAKREDWNTVARALADFSADHVGTAVRLLKMDSLYRSEKVLGAAEWLSSLHSARAAARPGQHRENVLWRAIASAPAGFCHPRSSMIGSLLEDIAAGMDFDSVSRRFAAKMHPLQYQRPTAAPSSAAIMAAEKLFVSMGLEPSLHRRFARLDDLVAVWRPADAKEAATAAPSIFGHLTTKESAPVLQTLGVPMVTMTWEKFARTILPTAEQIEVMAPARGNYTALVTAANADAPPIIQWDMPEQRNPVSSYVYHGGSLASQWGLTGGTYTKVTAVVLQPHMWHTPEKFAHHHRAVHLILAGAKDSRKSGIALFPEIIKGDLHGVRGVIEAFSKQAELSGLEEASACGLCFGAGEKSWTDAVLRVTSGGYRSAIRLDRWD